jgi:DNA adenine methylase
VIIERQDAVEVMRKHDGPATLHYVDPPYLPETRSQRGRRRRREDGAHIIYRHEMTRKDHIRLLLALKELRGMVVLSGYPSPLYERLLRGWTRVERAAMADGAEARTECLWLNPAAAGAQSSQAQLFEGAA